MTYRGYVINLRESTARRDAIREHLQSLGLGDRYERFEGICGSEGAAAHSGPLNAGSVGCGLSHQRLLAAHRNDGVHLHVLEDDAVIHPRLPQWFSTLPQQIPWDLLYTDVYFSMLSPQTFQQLNRLLKNYREQGGIALVNLHGVPFVGATSYFVNRNSIGKVADLIGTTWIGRQKHDDHINNLVQTGQVTAYAVIPFLSTRSNLSDQSTIDSEYTSLMQAMDLQRAAFYADANLEALAEKSSRLVLGGPTNPLLKIYSETTRSILEHIDHGIHRKRN